MFQGFQAQGFYVSGVSGIALLCFRGFRHRALLPSIYELSLYKQT